MTPHFFTALHRHGDRPALIPGHGQPVSYAELADRVARFSRRLGTTRKLVAVEAVASPEPIIAYLAALAAGHAVALLPAGDTLAMARFRRDYVPEAVFARQGQVWRLTLDPRGAGPLHPDLGLVLMTSGSTGHGKGVRLSTDALCANATAIAGYLDLTPADRAALVLPLHYSYGLSVLNSHLAAGASVWLAAGSMLDAGFLSRLAASGATNLSTVPHGYDLLDRIGFSDAMPDSLTTLTVAGGALRPERQRALAKGMARRGGRFFAMYGQTEAVARIAYLPPDRAESHAGMIGQPIPGGALSLIDDDGQTVSGDGAEGELVYRGPNVMMGYASSRADLALGADYDHLPTGDIARYEAGFYRIIGRKRRMSKIAGLRIGHDAVEAALADAGLVAAVWGDDCTLSVACEGAGDADAIAAQVAALSGLTCAHVRARTMPHLPRLPNGKPDYQTLARAPQPTAAGADLAEAFRQVFHPRPVRGADSFVSLGGDSLRHVELSLALERALGHLPADWERLSLSTLQAMSPAAGPDRTKTVAIGTEHVVRAGAIMAVVVAHETAWPVYGGAASMVVLIGLMLARFRRDALARGDAAAILSPLGRVLLPYYIILIGFALAWGRVPLGSALLISNFGIGTPATMDRLPFLYWFVEAYAQMLLLIAALVAVPYVRRMVANRPLTFGAGLLAGAMVLRLFGPMVLPMGGQAQFTLPWVLYLLALGWMTGVAQGQQRWLVLGLAALVMPLVAWLGGNWIGSWIKYSMVFGVIAALLFIPHIRLPRRVAGAVLTIASAAYMIYLTHRLVPNVLMADWVGILPGWLFSTLSITGGIALGLAVRACARQITALRGLRPLRLRPFRQRQTG